MQEDHPLGALARPTGAAYTAGEAGTAGRGVLRGGSLAENAGLP